MPRKGLEETCDKCGWRPAASRSPPERPPSNVDLDTPSQAMTIGVVVFLPHLCFVASLGSIPLLISGLASPMGPLGLLPFGLFFLGIVSAKVSTIYLWFHSRSSQNVPEDVRSSWMRSIWFLNVLVTPSYWFAFIWTPAIAQSRKGFKL